MCVQIQEMPAFSYKCHPCIKDFMITDVLGAVLCMPQAPSRKKKQKKQATEQNHNLFLMRCHTKVTDF